jgi:hypothetical protein
MCPTTAPGRARGSHPPAAQDHKQDGGTAGQVCKLKTDAFLKWEQWDRRSRYFVSSMTGCIVLYITLQRI